MLSISLSEGVKVCLRRRVGKGEGGGRREEGRERRGRRRKVGEERRRRGIKERGGKGRGEERREG